MKKITLALSVLVFTAASAAARGRGFSGARGGSGGPRGYSSRGFSRPLSRPTFVRAASHASTRSGGFASGISRSRSGFAHVSRLAGTPPAGGSGGGTGGTSSAPAAAPGWATPGAKILTAGQQPVYSNPAPSGTHSVDGGGFIAIDQGRANNVGGSGVTWAAPDRTSSSGSGAGGNGVTENSPAF
jgi:hypothetical protein